MPAATSTLEWPSWPGIVFSSIPASNLRHRAAGRASGLVGRRAHAVVQINGVSVSSGAAGRHSVFPLVRRHRMRTGVDNPVTELWLSFVFRSRMADRVPHEPSRHAADAAPKRPQRFSNLLGTSFARADCPLPL